MNGFVIGMTGHAVVCIYRQRRQDLSAVPELASVDSIRFAKQKATPRVAFCLLPNDTCYLTTAFNSPLA